MIIWYGSKRIQMQSHWDSDVWTKKGDGMNYIYI